MLVTSFSFFNELSIEKRNYARDFFLIMVFKRITLWKKTMSRDKISHGFQEIFTRWKKINMEGHMSRAMIGIRRSSSKSPT